MEHKSRLDHITLENLEHLEYLESKKNTTKLRLADCTNVMPNMVAGFDT